MTEIDRRIGESLDADDRAFLASLDEGRGLFVQIGDTFDGPLGGWAKLVAAASLALALVLFYSSWKLLTAQDTRALVLWAVAVLAALFAQGFIKQWFFARMNMLSVLRELKRMQVQVAMLTDGRG
jgi:hypothetical protein